MNRIKFLYRILFLSFVIFSMFIQGNSHSIATSSIKRPDIVGVTNDPNQNTQKKYDTLKSELVALKDNGELNVLVTKYNSTQVENRHIISGQFICQSAGLVVAILSDDGVTVTVNNTATNLDDWNHGQALPDLDSSLKVLDGAWTPGTTYNIQIDYSNTCYIVGGDDIDGLTVFFCGDVDITPSITNMQASFNNSIYPYSTTVGQTCTATITVDYTNVGAATKAWTLRMLDDSGNQVGNSTVVNYNQNSFTATTTISNIPVPAITGIHHYTCVSDSGDSVPVTFDVNEKPTFTLSKTSAKIKKLPMENIIDDISTDLWSGSQNNIFEETQSLTGRITENNNLALFESIEIVCDPSTHKASLKCKPNPGMSGIANFKISFYDDLNPGIFSNESSFTVTVQEPPTAESGSRTINEDNSIDDIIMNGTGELPLLYSIGTAPTHGTLAVDDQNHKITYIPNADYNGYDVFSYMITDNLGQSAEGTYLILVNPVNDPPVFDIVNQDIYYQTDIIDDDGIYCINNIKGGPTEDEYNDQDMQIVCFEVIPDDNTLFDILPTISPDGILLCTPKLSAVGQYTTLTIRAFGANGIVSEPKTMTLNIIAGTN